MTQSLSEQDVRAITRLLGNLAITGGDITEKRKAVLDGLAEIIGATRWIWIRGTVQKDDHPVGMSTLGGGWPGDKQFATFMAMASDTVNVDPGHARFGQMFFQHGHTTRTRQDLISDEDFAAAVSFEKYYRHMDHHQYVMSALHLGNDIYSAIALFRHRDATAFGPRERLITHIVVSEIDWLHRTGFEVAANTTKKARELSPRLKQVLIMVLAGQNPKQIAAALKLSVHTVRDYVRDLHGRFGVSGTQELMAHFTAGGGPSA